MADITSANAVLLLSVPLLLPVPQQIQGFSTDDIFETEDVTPVETLMGIDGTLSGGFVFTDKPMVITLQASSASNTFFDAWQQAQQAVPMAAPAEGSITLTSVGRTYVLTTGYLTRFRPIFDAKKVLQARRFRITWQNISPVPIGAAG